ncbi:MAG TPA: adenylate/guanylate cyclase domain-containing protein [Candidatus Binatia bacterium]|jgi:adenylate cyclase
MKCAACQAENLGDSVFCEECSVPLEANCAECGTGNRLTAKFCRKCRAPLAGVAAAAPDPRAFTTPKHLADKILQSKSALEGERKQVTVLFADVQGSMQLAEQMDPEEWRTIMQRFFEILSEGVERFEGFVDKFTGDGIMALFGAPIAHEDHAQRACYTALQLRDALAVYAREVKRRHGFGFSVRMGLHSGEVVVGTIGKTGDDLRMEYTAQGHTVGLAARMQELASPDTVYLTGATAQLVAGYFTLEDLGPFAVKGVADPVSVFQLQGLGAVRTRFDASRARGLTRFVGRDDDMRTLDVALERACAGSGQVVGVVAEAGTGKSRLCFEFLERCRAKGLRVLVGGGVAHGKNIPLLPILQIFREYYGITERDTDQQVREKIAGRMLLFAEEYRQVLPVVFDFFGVPDPKNPPPRMDPEARQRQLFSVLRRLTQQDVNQGPVVTLLEDLHWIDAASEAWIDEMVDAAGGSSQRLMIFNFRPEYRAPWMQKSWYHQLSLLPLGAAAIRELLADLLGNDPSLTGLVEAIHARTAGNPFFTEEVVQALVEGGHLAGTKGSYRLVTPVEKLDVPTRVQPLLAARIDRLHEREKRVLQTAAVIGVEFPEPILAAVAELPKSELDEALRVLKAGEFIYEQALYPVAEYAFKHPLTQQVALDSQLRERRRSTHRAVAHTIEALNADKLDQHAALLAHHWEEAGQKLIAARWHRRAAEWAGTNDIAAAVRHWQRVRELIRDAPDDEGAAALGSEACRQTLSHGFRLGISRDESERILAEGKRWAERSADGDAAALLHNSYSVLLLMLGDVEACVRETLESERLLRKAQDDRLPVLAAVSLIYPFMVVGRFAEAGTAADEVIAATHGRPELGLDHWGFRAAVFASFMKAAVELLTGELSDARPRLERTIELARQYGEVENEGWAVMWQAELAFFAGDQDAGLPAAQRAVELAERFGSPYSRIGAHQRLGTALTLVGQGNAAIAALEHALSLTRECGTGLEREALALASLAEAVLVVGDLARAHELTVEALTIADRIGAVMDQIFARRTLARVLLAREGAQAARAIAEALDGAERLIERSGTISYRPLVLLERAELARLAGDADARRRALVAAHRLFTAIGASGHAARLVPQLGA